MISLAEAYFFLCAFVAVVGSLTVVASRGPIRSAMGLFLVIVAVAGLFLPLHAQFLAAIQFIVYAGAVVVLLLFIIMMLGPDAIPASDRRGLFARVLGASVFIISGTFALALSNHALSALHSSFPQPKMEASFGGIDSFGMILFTDDVVPLELSAALLLVAVVGVLAVAQGHVNGSGKVLADLRATARRAALRADEARGRST